MVGGDGNEIREYAVKMRRIPEERLMKSLYEKGALTEDHLKGVAQVLAAFHSSALRNADIDQYGTPGRFKVNTDENFDQVKKYVGATIVPRNQSIGNLDRKLLQETRNSSSTESARARSEIVRDLHMEHICFTDLCHHRLH
jgi:aminoglycoside phosphotransferase family enzyme